METKTYTPGPWTVKGPGRRDGADDFAVVAGGEIIAEAFGRSSVESFHPSRANALLIAAAPDLVAALEEVAAITTGEGTEAEDMAAMIQGVVRAAIAKARAVPA